MGAKILAQKELSETNRLQALRDFQILDTGAEPAFDRLTHIAAAHYGVPIALVSLVDESRQWFKSRLGLDVCETSRAISFCTHAIRSDDPLIVNDASAHPAFAGNPLVTGPPHIRFYAGAPLVAESGARLGTLCIIDHAPRPDFSRSDADVLMALAALVIDEMELRLARVRAEAESRAKSDFIATMSHELRTPMTSVLGYVELLAETDLDEQQREFVNLVHSSSGHLLQLLNDALDLSRIESGLLKLKPEKFSPADLVALAVEFFAASARSKGLDLRAGQLPAKDNLFYGDARRIRQILYNLINNAIKFTERGHVSVSCELRPDLDDNKALHLAVLDTGIGIDDDMQSILFERFVQGDGKTSRDHYGAGLGLAICRELADAMGGSILCDRVDGGGSCFRVVIPEAQPDGQSAP